MKVVTIVFCTFIIAFLTSALFEWNFIATNYVRSGLTVALILVELFTGFVYLSNEMKTK